MLSENQLVTRLEFYLRDEVQFQTYTELQIENSEHIRISEMVNQNLIRIDLAGICQLDSSIHFFEAETQIHVNHPTIYSQFCDYCYLLCPDEQFEILNGDTLEEQLSWAKEVGVGVISISREGKIRNRIPAIQQRLDPEIREVILNAMDKRYKIPFSTVPLWYRPRVLKS
ncbi:MAG: hypothetical protein ACW98G_02385 [Candidatus Hodarchaeales archaeon]|jgi:hypothetical protein